MKKLFILGSFLSLALALCAQNNYFLFIQSENNQTYYVQANGKTLSSSPIGHLIIHGLKDSIYTLHIGFPKNQFSEQLFQVGLNRKDGGYQLKNLGIEGWALVNMQSLQLIKSYQPESKKQAISYGDLKKTDNFSMLMAGLVNDSAVLYTSMAKVEPPKESPKSDILDTPVTTTDLKIQDEAVKTDSVRENAELASNANEQKKDTPSIATIQDAPANDSIIIQPGIVKKPDRLEVDSSAIARNETPQPEGPQKDSLTSKPDQRPAGKSDSGMVIKQLPATSNAPQGVDTLLKVQSQAEANPSPGKPLIVWFSETRTGTGTEMVFFDKSVPDKTDTIRILIPHDSAITRQGESRDAGIDSNTEKKEEQKSGAGKFIGKIFGKKNDTSSDGANNTMREEKKSTIKVTTVENKRADPGATKNNKSVDADQEQAVKAPSQQKDSVNKKDSVNNKKASGNFLGKVFGKKNSPEPLTDKTSSTTRTSSIEGKASENTKPIDSAADNNGDGTSEEVRKLKKAQEEEEKTSTERFFGKIFGKKKKGVDKDSVSGNETKDGISIKVTDVTTSTHSDTGRSTANENKTVLLNSDCHNFATDNEVDKLKVKLLSRKDIDAQIVEAKKFFKLKCVTTRQVKTLSTLYRTDSEKYKLFDASYPFVSDSSNFMDLVVLLTEPYYINRFIAMVRM